MVYYKLIKVIVDTLTLIKVITNIVILYYGFLNLIVINQGLLFILNSDYYYIISCRSKKGSLLPLTTRLMAKHRDKIAT